MKIGRKYIEVFSFFIIVSIFVVVCNRQEIQKDKIITIKDKITKRIEYERDSLGVNANCMIDIKKITPFKWDSLYVFTGFHFADDITEITRSQYNGPYINDNENRMIFIKDNNIVYTESYMYDLEGIYVKFIPLDQEKSFSVYSSDESIFHAVQFADSGKNKNYYSLISDRP